MTTATLLQNGEQTFFDDNGIPLALGEVYFYIPNTSTPKDTWQDAGGSTLNTNPVTLDAAGRAIIYGEGSYRQVVKDVDGNLIWDQLTASTALGASGVVAGSYTNTNLTVNSQGLITTASNGSAGGSGTAAGQCKLQYISSSVIQLTPWNGNNLVINSTNRTIPSGGVTLAPTALTPNTLYYIYAYMSGSTMTLEASATGYTTQTTTGINIKSGDATRTLVGMARPITGPNWVDASTQRFLRSWFNESGLTGSNYLNGNKSTTSTTFVEIDSACRLEALFWTNEAIHVTSNIQVTANVANTGVHSLLTVNEVTGAVAWARRMAVVNVYATGGGGTTYECSDIALTFEVAGVVATEGYSYVALLGHAESPNTAYWIGQNSFANQQNTGMQFSSVRR